jgi:hypothetical protein
MVMIRFIFSSGVELLCCRAAIVHSRAIENAIMTPRHCAKQLTYSLKSSPHLSQIAPRWLCVLGFAPEKSRDLQQSRRYC